MTSKVYKTAQGKTIDLGTIMLRNEHVRAVGNMNVNARGDQLDSGNKVIETKNQRLQRQADRTTVAAPVPEVHSSMKKAKAAQQVKEEQVNDEQQVEDLNSDEVLLDMASPENINESPAPVEAPTTGGGLAAAIARSKVVKQEKEKTLRQMAQSTPGVRKI